MKKNNPISVALFLFLFCLLTPFSLNAGDPTDFIRTTLDKVLAILKNPRLEPHARMKERRDQLRRAIYPRFDFTEKAKRSLGSHWRHRTPEEQREFVEIFKEHLGSLYVHQFESYRDVKLLYTRETQDKNYAEVDTKIVRNKGKELSINYKLHLVKGNWKIYDIVIENFSLVNNYRSQFNRIITHSSYKELLRRLKKKADRGREGEKNNDEKLNAIRGWMLMILASEGSRT